MNKRETKQSFLSSGGGKVFIFVVLALFAIVGFFWISGTGSKNKKVDENHSVFHWVGGGNNNWSTAANWDINEVPKVGSRIIFDGSSSEDSFVDRDFAGEIGSLEIRGYKGKIEQNNNLIIKEDYYQDSGEYNVVADLDINGDFIQKEESIFLVSSGETRISGELEAVYGFSLEPDAIVYVKNFSEWKRFFGLRRRDEYYAAKEDSLPNQDEEVWSFYNATNSFHSYVSQERGWTLSAVSGYWSWNYLFKEIRRDNTEPLVSQDMGITAQENRISIQRGENIEEWYENTYKGVEQGFTIKEKPQGDGKLVLDGQVTFNNLTVEEKSKNTLALKVREEITAFEYSHLLTTDATGKEIPTELELVEMENGSFNLRIIVEDSEAQYPIIIDPLSSNPDWVGLPSSDQQSGYFGKSVSGAGDVNNDGFEDILIGQYFYYNGVGAEGALNVYYGSEAGLPVAPAVPDWQVIGPDSATHLGYAVASGDFNGDTISDVVGGADYWNDALTTEEEGKVFVYYGHSDDEGGLSAFPDWTAEGGQIGAHFGRSVANAGNVDGDSDGCDDLIVGAFYYDSNGYTYNGSASLYLGSPEGLSPTPIWTVYGGATWDCLGSGVSGAGDVNKDGYADVIVGALGANEAYVYLGGDPITGLSETAAYTFRATNHQSGSRFGNSVSDAGDLNGDTWPDLIVGAPYYDNILTGDNNEGAIFVYYGQHSNNVFTGFNSEPDWQYIGDGPINSYLGHSVSSAGDINHDGFSDIIVGERGYDGDFVNEGRISVFYGKSGGLTPGSSPDWTNIGGKENTFLGYSVSEVGDIKDNGYAGIMAGAYGWDIAPDDGRSAGKVYLYDGFQEDNSVDTENVVITVSTVDQDQWFDDRCSDEVDNDGDGDFDEADPDCDGGNPNDADLNTYLVCDKPGGTIAEYIDPFILDYEYTPCDIDDVHDDYYSTDAPDQVDIQPVGKNFTIKVDAADSSGIQSIEIEWMSDVGTNADPSDWLDTNAKKHIFNDCENVSSCSICVVGGNCGMGHDVILASDLGVPSGHTRNKLFFRAIITDNHNNVIMTGWDDGSHGTPVLDKFYRVDMCTTGCAPSCDVTNPIRPSVTDILAIDDCAVSLLPELSWAVDEAQSEFYLEITDVDTGKIYSVNGGAENSFIPSPGTLIGGDLEPGKEYSWKVIVKDDVIPEYCREWSDWAYGNNFSTCPTCGSNSAPVINTTNINPPSDFCNLIGLPYVFSWTFSDNEGDGQSEYKIKVVNSSDLSEMIVSSSSVTSSFTAYSGFLDYENEYTWYVMIKDDYPDTVCREWSGWYEGGTFTTESEHPYVAFVAHNDDGDDCIGGSGCEFLENINLENRSIIATATATYEWIIEGVSYGNGNIQDISRTFAAVDCGGNDECDVTFIVTDEKGCQCSLGQTLSFDMGLPVWNEIAPGAHVEN